jgi:hypothetical protein
MLNTTILQLCSWCSLHLLHGCWNVGTMGSLVRCETCLVLSYKNADIAKISALTIANSFGILLNLIRRC